MKLFSDKEIEREQEIYLDGINNKDPSDNNGDGIMIKANERHSKIINKIKKEIMDIEQLQKIYFEGIKEGFLTVLGFIEYERDHGNLEKEKVKWLIENNILSRILIASKNEDSINKIRFEEFIK